MAPEQGQTPDRGYEPHAGGVRTTQERSPNEAGLGETVKAGVNPVLGSDADNNFRDRLAGSPDEEGFVRVLDGLTEFVRRQPITALLIATGVGLCVGRLLALHQAAERA